MNTQTDIKPGDTVFIGECTAGYEVAEIKKFPHGYMVGIYDEPPSKHIDWWNLSSVKKTPHTP